jgi:hypothetical protein
VSTRQWTGGGSPNAPKSGSWSTAANWAGNSPPVIGDDIVFGGSITGASAYAVTLDVNPSVNTVKFSSSTAHATLIVGANTLTVTNNGTGAITLNAQAAVTLAGGTITLNGGTSATIADSGSISGSGILKVSGTSGITGNGSITASGGTLELNSTLTGNALALSVAGSTDVLKLDQVSNVSSLSFNGSTGKLEVGTAGTLTLTTALSIGGGTVALDGAGTTQLTDANGVTLAGGTVSGTGGVAANTNISDFGTVAIPISTAGTITASGGTLDLTGTVSGRTLVINTTAGSDLKIDGTATSSAAIAISDANQTLEVGALGNLTITVAESIANGTIKLDGGTLGGVGGGTLTIGSGGKLTGSGTVNDAISGTGGTITASNGVLNLVGSVTGGPSFAIDSGSTSTLKFSGAATAASPIAIASNTQTLEIGSTGNLTINGAESVTNGTIKLDGGTLALKDSTGANFALTVGSGGTLTGSGTAPNDITLAGGTVSQFGGTLNAAFITGSGTVKDVTGTSFITASGGTLHLTGTVSGPQLAVAENTTSVLEVDGNVTAGSIQITKASQTVEIGASGTLTLTDTTAAESITNGTIRLDASSSTLNANGGLNVGSGAKVIGTGVVNGAILGNGGVVEGQGGVLTVSNNVASSTILLEVDSGSTLSLGGTVGTSTSFTYLNNVDFSGTLLLANSTAMGSFETNGVISGMHEALGAGVLATDVLDLRPISFATVGSTDILGGNTIEVFGNANHTNLLASFHLADQVAAGTHVDWQSDANGGTSLYLDDDPCYVAGTHILTATGERMVESLMQGDIVLTLAGEELNARPVKWIGQRRIDLTAHPRPETAAPIRIRRGAFAENMPHRDLLVSPDHAIFVDGKLICARQLVNGTTIRQEKGWTSVEYFHVELDAHAILLAEGLPAESYLNTGNHGFFANSSEPLVLHPNLTDETDYPAREAGSCAPFVTDEASVQPVWQRLAERAAALGQPTPKLDTTSDPELRIVAKGRTVRPLYGENGLYIFALPKGTTEVRLISRAGSPADVSPWLDDRRCLGVNVERIVLRGASVLREVPVDHPDLSQGWHVVERDGIALRRWTTGDAVLPLPTPGGPTMLEIRVNNGGMGYVVGADAKAEVERKVA